MLTERMHEIISGENFKTKKQLITFWEQYYINFTEDARADEYNNLKREYFKVADEYEKILDSNPSKAEDEHLYKKYTIRQRKIGIRMISAARGTEYENQSKTFESQIANSPAGDRSATNIRFQTQSKARKDDGPWGEPIKNFSDFIRVVVKSRAVQKRLVGRLLLYLYEGLLEYLIYIYIIRKSSKKAPRSDHWSNLIGRVIGKDISVKIMKSRMYLVFGSDNSIIISDKIIEKLSEEEIIALSLYSYAAMAHLLSKGIVFSTLKFIMVTSIDMALSYIATIEIAKDGGTDTGKVITKLITAQSISEVVISILLFIFKLKLKVARAIKYVKDKGYLVQLMAARKKLPKKEATQIPEIDIETAKVSVGLFTKFLSIIGFEKSVEKDNISKPISFLQKITSIFKRFK